MSRTGRLFNRNALSAITSISRRNNIKREVTGLLVFYENRFFQVLEGEEAVLAQLMTRILADQRHAEFQMIEHGPVEKRAFTTWRLCCTPEDAPRREPSVSLVDLIPVNSDLRGRDPDVRKHVRTFLSSLRELPVQTAS